jgi:hypothetical protein
MKLLERPAGGDLPAGFLDLPHALYRDDPNWIPEERERVAALFGPQNPWLDEGQAHAFCIPSKARAAAFRPHELSVGGTPAAFFGYWESAGDERGDALVMDAVRDWAAGVGARRLFGPVDFSTALGYRLRLPGGDGGPPYVGEPYNRPSYAAQLEALGLEVERRYVSPVLGPDHMRALAAAEPPSGYRFEALDVATWLANADELFELANAIFADNFAFTPFSREEFDLHFGAEWAGTLDPRLSLLVRGPDGDLAAACLVYPNYGPLVVQGAGEARVSPSAVNYAEHVPLLARMGVPDAVLRTGGTTAAHRKSGVATAFVAESAHRALEHGITSLTIGTMREDNPSRRIFRRGQRSERWYALYATDLYRARSAPGRPSPRSRRGTIGAWRGLSSSSTQAS